MWQASGARRSAQYSKRVRPSPRRLPFPFSLYDHYVNENKHSLLSFPVFVSSINQSLHHHNGPQKRRRRPREAQTASIWFVSSLGRCDVDEWRDQLLQASTGHVRRHGLGVQSPSRHHDARRRLQRLRPLRRAPEPWGARPGLPPGSPRTRRAPGLDV